MKGRCEMSKETSKDVSDLKDLVHRRIIALYKSDDRKTLANLRKAAGCPPGGAPNVWRETLSELPSPFQGDKYEPTYTEWAAHIALTVYALHQQGQGDLMHVEGVSLGTAMRRLVRDADDEPRVKSRFDRAAMAGDITALAYWLRGLVQILRSESVKLDYSLLAEDLYWFQFPERRSAVRLRWGRDFYAKARKPAISVNANLDE
jgi:CRISPR system Cascade subunit CasB